LSKQRPGLIAQAFSAAVDVIGERSKQLLIEDMKYHGVNLDDPELDLQKLMKALKEILREEAAEMIIERIMIKLDEIESKER
jgi:hypothetical protein